MKQIVLLTSSSKACAESSRPDFCFMFKYWVGVYGAMLPTSLGSLDLMQQRMYAMFQGGLMQYRSIMSSLKSTRCKMPSYKKRRKGSGWTRIRLQPRQLLTERRSSAKRYPFASFHAHATAVPPFSRPCVKYPELNVIGTPFCTKQSKELLKQGKVEKVETFPDKTLPRSIAQAQGNCKAASRVDMNVCVCTCTGEEASAGGG